MIKEQMNIADSSASMEAMQCYLPYRGEKVLIGLSGGINSMAVLCDLAKSGVQPSELHLFYAHFEEHSPDTLDFVKDGFAFAEKHFDNVKTKITYNSIIEWFEQQKMIPHPMFSPCSRTLKIEPIITYSFENAIKYDLVGYVKHELKRRGERQQSVMQADMFSVQKHYPIGEFSDDWCFEIVDELIGWHPKIYDIKDSNGKRLFKHNNCLPCKNMTLEEIELVRIYYPELYQKAMDLAERLSAYFGRDKDKFYATFGRDLGQPSTCETCRW